MNIRQVSRKSRITQLKTMIMNAGKENKVISYEKILQYCMSNFYCSRRTAKEYIDTLIDGELIVRDEDYLFVKQEKLVDNILDIKEGQNEENTENKEKTE